ncbi:mucin-2-like isoform X5 [Zophobas morio]|uniref:mucin-2-like isoform X5 n=1 Tax=Zophobas morio TaxID=2755281 RepID=UPI003083C262
MGGYAWVTLATNDSYSLGALVLANSLKQLGTSHQLVVLVTPGVTNAMRQKLSATFNVVQEVNILDSKDETNLRLLKRPELGVTFTKLHCWRLTQFDKCVFLDADTLVLRNCDELFDREELSAAPDVGWPDCFNSGVFVYRPSNETYEKLVQFALEKGSFDGGDQGLLNLYFSDWATKDISKHLPFIYNMCSTACYSYLPAFKQFGVDAKIIHFIGSSKPWLQYFNTETRKVQPSSDVKHLEGILQHWWNIFCSLIHPQLTTEMSGLAGAFAQLTLGAPRTAEQCALDDHLRRQGWEVGNIDYMGRDSFDNIWSKICETLSAGLPSAPKTTDATPSPTVRESEKSASEAEAQPSPQTTSFQDSTSAAPISQSIPLESQIISESKASPETPVKTPGASEGSFALVTPESGDLQCPLRVAEQPKEIAEVVQQVAATEPPVAPVLKTAEEKIASPQEGQASVSPPTAPTIQPSVEAAPTSQTSGETVTSSTPAESPLSSQPSSELPPASSPSVETPATLQPSGETPTAPQPSSEISTTPQLSGETPLTLQTSSEVLSTSQSLAEAPTLSQPSIETPPSPGVPQLPEVAPQQPEVAPQQPEVAPQQPEVAPQQPEVAPQQPEVVPQLSEVVPSQPVAETALISPPATEAPAPSKLSKEVLSPIAQPTTECTPISKPPTEVETPPSSQADTEGLPSPKAVTGASKSEVPSTQPSTEIPPISPLSTQVPPSTKSTAEIVKPPIEALSSQPSADTALSQPSTETPSTTKPKQPSIESPSTVTETPAAETSAPEPSVVVPPTSKPAPSAEVSTPSKVDSPPSDTDKSKSVTEQSKAAPKPKPESTSAASSVSPTPPPRKTGGGGKKKSKK